MKTKKITKSFKTKLNLSKKNDKSFRNMAGTYRILYNNSMQVMEDFLLYPIRNFEFQPLIKREALLLSKENTLKLLNASLKDNPKKRTFVSKVDSGIKEAAAFEANYMNNTHYPFSPSKFMRKKDGLKFKTTTKIKIFSDHIYIPKCGNVKLFEKNYLPQNAVLSDITFKQQGGDWYISFKATVEVEDTKTEKDFYSFLNIDFKNDGTLVVNNKEYPSIISLERYQKEFKRLRGLLKKYERQCEANSEYHRKTRKTLVVSRNMLKLRQQIETSTCRLYNMKLDYFRKVSHELTKTKSGCALLPSNDIIRKKQNKHLSRMHREAGTVQFFDILHKKLQNSGIILHRVNSDGAVCPELQGIMACGGLNKYRQLAQKLGSVKQVLSLAA